MEFQAWHPRPPAAEAQLAKLRDQVRFPLPAEYLDLLRRGNGGEGALALPPLWLQLWSADEAVEFARFRIYAHRFPGCFFFAANGAGEHMAMRRAAADLVEIVVVELGLGPDSAQVIAPDFAAFIQAIGK
ncbi:MAG TPA: SMI1/KNR4 family protein [Burkholderiales bacterium]